MYNRVQSLKWRVAIGGSEYCTCMRCQVGSWSTRRSLMGGSGNPMLEKFRWAIKFCVGVAVKGVSVALVVWHTLYSVVVGRIPNSVDQFGWTTGPLLL